MKVWVCVRVLLLRVVGDLILPYTPIEIKFTDILLPAPSYQLLLQPFRMLWDRLPFSLYADCYVDTYKQVTQHNVHEYIQGPQHAIGFVNVPPFPCPGVVQAAGLSKTWSGDWIAFYCIAALSYEKVNAKTPVTPSLNDAAVQATEDSPVWFLQYEFRSTNKNNIRTLRDNCQQWLDDLTNESVKAIKLYEGTNSKAYKMEGQSVMLNGLHSVSLNKKLSEEEILAKWRSLSGREKPAEDHE